MKPYLETQLRLVLDQMEVSQDFVPEFQTPGNPEHGDLATNAAMQLARVLKRSPRQIGMEIAERLLRLPSHDPDRIEAVEVAGPGFLNIRFSDRYLTGALAGVLERGADFGKTTEHAGKTALVEYVSANPTGPLTVGHGRNAVLGDTIATLLEWTGYAVTREYYFNDAGRQMRVLGESVKARYDALVLAARGEPVPTKTIEGGLEVPEDFPEDGYRGTYIQDIAQRLFGEHGDALSDEPAEGAFKAAAVDAIFADINATMKGIGIEMDSFFNEHTLYDDGKIDATLEALRAKGVVYEKDGATWFKTTDFGKDKDTVLVKSTGEPTYRLPDIAYHADKLSREVDGEPGGFDLAVDVFGADHIATIPDVLKAVELLGHDPERVKVLVYQFVTLVRGGAPVKMSTRKATYETLDDLIEEVGADVVRFFFLMRSPNTHLEFDLDLAKESSEKNPVFYLQYAHARIASIRRKAEEVGVPSAGADLSLLAHEAELSLVKEILRLPGEVALAADQMAPHRLATYLREVAVAFSKFYDQCHIIGESADLAAARLSLARAAQTTLANGLAILGIDAPETM